MSSERHGKSSDPAPEHTGPAGGPPGDLSGDLSGDPASGDPGADAGPGDAHDDTGLALARSVARSLAKGPSLRRTGRAGGKGGQGGRGGRRPSTTPSSSGAHPDDRDPQTLDATIGRLVAEQGWGADVRVHGVFSRWDAIVGREVAQHARPISFQREDEGGRLLVRTDSTAWATQMRMLAATVVRRLNEELGDGTVRVIDVEGPAMKSWTKGRWSVRGGRGPRDTYG